MADADISGHWFCYMRPPVFLHVAIGVAANNHAGAFYDDGGGAANEVLPKGDDAAMRGWVVMLQGILVGGFCNGSSDMIPRNGGAAVQEGEWMPLRARYW
jgi:hypothetical protein